MTGRVFDDAVEAGVRAWQQLAGWDPDEPMDEDREDIEGMRRDMRVFLSAAADALEGAIRAEALAAVEPMFEGIGMQDAIRACIVEHTTFTETDAPNGVPPYTWCACGWRSDMVQAGMEHAARVTHTHLTNAMHSAVRDHLRAVIADADAVAKHNAAIWDKGYTSGHSNAMRQTSDEPNAPTTPNPYRTSEPTS